mmetsp:Transcript_55611/g.104537  ORF Transcript_55611/g.104537 Transcript_55611/m.104537 type:complete len:205 (-) Transcript_55611:124-738(-)
MAIRRLNRTMLESPMKSPKMSMASGARSLIGLTIPDQPSSVMIWNNENIALVVEPKYSCTRSSSLNLSFLTRSSRTTTAKVKCTMPPMTMAHRSNVVHSITPCTSIQSSLKKGMIRIALHRRVSLRMRRAPNRRPACIGIPIGIRIHVMSTPVTQMRKASNKFITLHSQSVVKAKIRMKNSIKKIAVKTCSELAKINGLLSSVS